MNELQSIERMDRYVASFEEVLFAGQSVEITDYLPPITEPLYEEVLCELIRVELEYGWEHSQPKPLDQYILQFPDLFRSPENRYAIAFEEHRLRKQAGENPSWEEYEARFQLPQKQEKDSGDATAVRPHGNGKQPSTQDGEPWLDSNIPTQPGGCKMPGEVEVIEITGGQAAAPGETILAPSAMPQVGSLFLGFRLKKELGQGAFGRVYLAHQQALADRPVALKVAPNIGQESQTLAQLQHTNVMPIYSVHSEGPYHAVCMPYFGSMTLYDILKDVQGRQSIPRSGQDVFSTVLQKATTRVSGLSSRKIDNKKAKKEEPSGESELGIQKLQGLSYVDAILWLGKGLADGLAHAHDRGILHRDVKPANILLSDDGQPLLLDFNLSVGPVLADTEATARMGGTLPYMALEHLEAFRGDERTVDKRSDICSLGIVLYELLAGRSPFPLPADAPRLSRSNAEELVQIMVELRTAPIPPLRKWNRDVSPAIASIIDHCLSPDPANRYQSAHELREDIQRQLESRPLRYAKEPSWWERAHKCARRSPTLFRRVLLGALGIIVLLVLGLGARLHQASSEKEAQQHLQAFLHEYHEAQFTLSTNQEEAHPKLAEQRAKQALHRFGALNNPNWRTGSHFQWLPSSAQKSLEKRIGSLLLLMAAAREREASTAQLAKEKIEEAFQWLQEAGRCLQQDTPSPVVQLQKADLHDHLKQKDQATALRTKARSHPATSAQDSYLLAHRATVRKEYRKALPLLDQAIKADPQSYWAHFLRGICYDGLGRDRDATAAYTTCIALDPRFYGTYLNRGLASLRQRDYAAAQADFTQVIRRRPKMVAGYINRALAYQGRKAYKDAIDDLSTALELGASARAYFMRSRAHRRAGNLKAAAADLQEGLRRKPNDEKSWIARGLARVKNEPEAALDDFNQALRLNPQSRSALNNQAYVYSEHLNQPEKAIACLDRVTRLYPDYAPAFSGRGVLHARLGARAKAIQDAKAALQLDPDPSVIYQVGCIYALTSEQTKGDRNPAISLLSKALQQGFGGRYLANDPDLNPLRSLPEFQRLLAAASTLRQAKQAPR